MFKLLWQSLLSSSAPIILLLWFYAIVVYVFLVWSWLVLSTIFPSISIDYRTWSTQTANGKLLCISPGTPHFQWKTIPYFIEWAPPLKRAPLSNERSPFNENFVMSPLPPPLEWAFLHSLKGGGHLNKQLEISIKTIFSFLYTLGFRVLVEEKFRWKTFYYCFFYIYYSSKSLFFPEKYCIFVFWTIFNPILPGLFWSFSARGVFGSTPCNSFIWPSINLKLGTSIGMSKKYSHTKNCEAIFRNDVTMTSFPIFCNFFVSCPILLKFCTEMPLGISNKNTKFCWDWLRSDVTVTSSLILRTRFVKSTLQRMCCHGNMKHCILLKFCTEVLIIISKDTSKFCEDWVRNSVTVTSLLRWMGWFRTSADSKMCFHGNINSPILLKFGTKIQLSISNKITNFC